MAKKLTKRGKTLTARQKRLVPLLPAIAAGTITKKDALLKAGYSEGSSNQQQGPLGTVRIQTAMQKALKDAGVTEERIAKKIGKGMDSVFPQVGLGFTKLAAELIDAFPSKKIEITEPATYKDTEDVEPKAKTPEEAKKLAERQ